MIILLYRGTLQYTIKGDKAHERITSSVINCYYKANLKVSPHIFVGVQRSAYNLLAVNFTWQPKKVNTQLLNIRTF